MYRENLTVKEIIVARCLKCGAEIPAGAPACPVCGTQQAAAAAYVAPMAVPPAPPPANQGSSAVKIILIIVVVFVGLGVLGLGAVGFVAWRTAHAIRAAVNDNKMSLNLPGGSFSADASQHYSASDLGTEIYPGATQGKGGMRMTLPTGTMTQAMYLTSDSKDQVIAFYKNKFGTDNVTAFDTAEGSVITYAKSQGESVVVTVMENPSENEGKTLIQIVHTVPVKSS